MHPILPGATYRFNVPLKNFKADNIKLKYNIQGKPETFDFKRHKQLAASGK